MNPCVLLAVVAAITLQNDADPKFLEQLRDRAANATTRNEAEIAFHYLLTRSSREHLEELRTDSCPSVRLQVAWELARNKDTPVALRDPRRLLGFFEGTAGMSLPMRWQVKMLGAGNQTREAYMQVIKDYLPICPFLIERGGLGTVYVPEEFRETIPLFGAKYRVRAPRDTSLSMKDGKLSIAFGKKSVTVNENELRAVLKPEDPSFVEFSMIRPCISEAFSFIVFFDETGSEFPLICVNAQGKIAWHKQIWLNRVQFFQAMSGPRLHEVEITANKDFIAICGENNGSLYLEVFEQKSGKSTCRFSSEYSINKKPAGLRSQ